MSAESSGLFTVRLIACGRGNPGNRLLPKEFTDHALEIIRKNYSDFGPTLVREKLEETHGLVLGKETVLI